MHRTDHMNVLFYVEPWIERAWPSWKSSWVELLFRVSRTLNKSQEFSEARFFFLIGDAQERHAAAIGAIPRCSIGVIQQRELRALSSHYNDVMVRWYKGTYRPDDLNTMKGLVHSKLGDFEPDIIWTFMSPVPFLRELFPNALVIHNEIGALSYQPYPKTWFLDPAGVFKDAFFVKHFAALLQYEPSPGEWSLLTSVRSHFCNKITSRNPFKKEQILAATECDQLLFFPLQYDGHFEFEGNSTYRTQFELVVDLLDALPSHVALTITEHPSRFGRDAIPQDAIEYLEAKYRNFVLPAALNRDPLRSQYLLDLCDGVFSISSTLGLQALLWKKPVFTEGCSQLRALSTATHLQDIERSLRDGYPEQLDRLLAYLLARYFVVEGEYFTNPRWLGAFLKRSWDKHQAGETQTAFFEPIADPEDIFRAYVKHAPPLRASSHEWTSVAAD
jgi:hypothetical protein